MEIQEKALRNVQNIEVNGRKFFISSIPATKAQRMLIAAFGAFKSFFSQGAGGIAAFPAELLTELNSYAGAYNDSGAQVQFVDDDITDMMVDNPMDLMEVQVALVEKNFGFFADGRLNRVVERLSRVLAPQQAEAATPNA